ncbi:DUF4167 domain-containing protein [Sphingomonas sp. RP10(2022)]|uniref:DUF4167 domain-containing protein n=1 Tax=Sphingomonas liriopis TaxID=2949094 RepID=A0A9X2KPR9_9SPHN|nr:DUF4167 domain-containing protein [Sphingomonas liriopis]MCP3734200.1 DUF4167 domain-containing protein [Sphingomonas liriopis]
MINNRQQNGRRRGRGGNNNGGGGNGPRQGGQGRPDNGNRIDSRARGNANQLFEKYKNLAGEAQRQGDRVNTEYYLQFADHYFRVLADQRGRFETDTQPRRQQPFDLNDDDDYGDEGEPIRAGEQEGDSRDSQQRDDRQPRRDRQDGEPRQARGWDNRDDRGNRDDRPQRDERGSRDDRPQREERAQRDDRPQQRDERTTQRDDRPQREDRVRRQRVEAEQPVEVAGQHRADPLAADESLNARAEAVLEADAPVLAPRRGRGRPRRDAQVDTVAETSAESQGNGVDADRLPPPLNIAAANDADGEAPKPRRRRTVRTPAAEASAE